MLNCNRDVEGCLKFEHFIKENKDFLDNVIVKSFLGKERNKLLLIQGICMQNDRAMEKFNMEFKKFYFRIRFTTFISNTLYYNALNFDKRRRKMLKRNPLTVDKPLGELNGDTFREMLIDSESSIKVENLFSDSKMDDYITNPILFETLQKLTPKQKKVIDLAYVNGLSDTEIGKRLGKTQQAVSKLHKKAIKEMNDAIIKKRGVIFDNY